MRDTKKIFKPKSEEEIRETLKNMHIFDIWIELKRRKNPQKEREIKKLLCFKHRIVSHFLTSLDKWRIFICSFYLAIFIFACTFNAILFPKSMFFSEWSDNVTLFFLSLSIIFILYMIADAIISTKFYDYWLTKIHE
jgi:hypothetical protein